jgi:ferredoxin
MATLKQRIKAFYPALSAAANAGTIAGFLIAHVGHREALHQNIPRPFMRVMSRYEHLGMRAINFLTTRDWVYNNPTLKRGVDWLSDKIMGIVNGEVLTIDEAKEMVGSIIAAGHPVATGTCPCRRARNEISDTVPNNTDMVFGEWAETYMENYPGLYHYLDEAEAKDLLDEFDRHGFIHQVYGYNRKEGAAFVMCNCDKSICIPLIAQKKRGFQAFRKGRSVALVDPSACKGTSECGVCLKRCPFDARTVGPDGKAMVDRDSCFGCGVCVVSCTSEATSLERKKGAQLVYARKLVT